MTDNRFRKSQHLRNPQDFAQIYERRCRASDQNLLIFAAPNELTCTRIGLSVSKKLGNAVRRARLKRLLREAFRLSQHDLPAGFDFILIPRQNTDVPLPELKASLVRCAGQATRKLASENRR